MYFFPCIIIFSFLFFSFLFFFLLCCFLVLIFGGIVGMFQLEHLVFGICLYWGGSFLVVFLSWERERMAGGRDAKASESSRMTAASSSTGWNRLPGLLGVEMGAS